jgi:hypothetical protein
VSERRWGFKGKATEGYNNRKKKLLGLFHNGGDVSETCEMKSGASSRFDGVDSDHSSALPVVPIPPTSLTTVKTVTGNRRWLAPSRASELRESEPAPTTAQSIQWISFKTQLCGWMNSS